MARLFADENFPEPAVRELRRLGHDVLTVHDAGRSGEAWPDLEVLEFAGRERRVLVTLNRRDFLRLHAENQDHPGLVVCTFDLDFIALASRIHEAVVSAGELHGRALRVNRPPR